MAGNRSIRPRVDPPRITRFDPPRIIQSRSNLPCKQLDIICFRLKRILTVYCGYASCMDILKTFPCICFSQTFRYHLLRGTVYCMWLYDNYGCNIMKKILRSTLRYKTQSKVSNSAPKSVSILRAAKAILFGSNALEHK